ncbi:MAG: SDR family NAD(P)-dependent oxidoreductase [Novosphingobium sp.]|nr:SDR family NAD(P)-dependent oxidoreductase [Novosphingobium sp.]
MERSPVWFVTGAASGFGRELVAEALKRGARVAATARDPRRLAELGDDVLVLPLDVTLPNAVCKAVEAAEARFGAIDVLVNNAGYGLIAAVEEASQDEIDALIGTHFTGTLDLIRAVLPGMRARRRGHIVNFSSVAGFSGSAGTALYAAAKFAVEGLSEGLAREVAPLGIKVTIVEPGPFQTSFFTTSRKMGATRIADYDGTSGAYRDRASKTDPWLPGDPARGAAAIADVVGMDAPPLRLLLGAFAVERARAAYAARLAEVDRWEALSRSADRPDAAGRPWP